MTFSPAQRGGAEVPGPQGPAARLLVAGDTHGNLDWIEALSATAAQHGCDGVVQLGDFGLWPDQRVLRSEKRLTLNDGWLDAVAEAAAENGVWWRFLDGNHDAHPLARADYPAGANGVRPLRSGLVDWADRGSCWTWCGRRFAALGGAVSVDREWRTEGYSYWSTEEITEEDVQALSARAGGEGVDVLLTHDAPLVPRGVRPLADRDLAADCARSIAMVQRAADGVRPALLLHGHFHRDYEGTIVRPWGTYAVVGLSSDMEADDPFGGPWCILELPSLAVVPRREL